MLVPRSPEMGSPPASTSFASLVFPSTESAQPQLSAKTDIAKSVIEWLFVIIVNINLPHLLLASLNERVRVWAGGYPDRLFLLAKVCLFCSRSAIGFGIITEGRHEFRLLGSQPYERGSYRHAPPFPDPTLGGDIACMYGYAYPGPSAAHLPYPVAAHARDSRPIVLPTRGRDIGEGGARLNGDMELVLSDKDILPVYDGLDRPPKYAFSPLAIEGAVAASSSRDGGDVRIESNMMEGGNTVLDGDAIIARGPDQTGPGLRTLD
ncbi:hypothetical protein C8R43DRAFT_1116046 [Mycena crocata]|nr:hypothetical protein C8R43DRAFT_1116046 [Mycena crocata]